MTQKDLKYKTVFSSTIRPLVSEERDKYLALASLADVGDFIPDIDAEENIDLLPIAFNACVVNRVNKNGDVIDASTASKIYENFINKPINIEHNRDKVVGVILTAGFSEFGTDTVLTKEQISDNSTPFNITLGGVFWKVVNSELADLIEESSDPTSENYMTISASWELGFSDFNIILLDIDEKNIENGQIISEKEAIEEIQEHLKAFGGNGCIGDDKKAYRQVIGEVVPLGIGLTDSPAADVKGVATEVTKEAEKEEEFLVKSAKENNNISQDPKRDVIPKEKSIIMKIKSVNDITDDLLKTVEATVVSDFIEEELKHASEKFNTEKTKLQDELTEARNERETLSKDHEELKSKLEEVEKSLADLEKEKKQREAEAKFNERMALLDEEYELNDEDREVLASDIKDMNEEDFVSFQKKISILLKNKTKAYIEAEESKKAEELKSAEEAKASEESEKEEVVVETAVDEADKENDEIPNSIQAEEETLLEKYKKAFSIDQFETN
tara:strand:- start:18384 stop:19886 length:1503 start_codon:yes stop_codon:yes gene_type:complete